MVLADLTCDPQAAFDRICRAISPHDPSGIAGPVAERLVGPLLIFIALYLVGRLVRRLLDAAMQRGGTDLQVHALIHNMITAVTYVVAILSAIVVAGVNVAVLLTVAGLGTVAIGLALQDLLRNVLAGIWLLLEHPFRLGDDIAVLDQSGTVQSITLRTTTLRTGDGRLAILPNLTAFTNPVVNASTYDVRQRTIAVRLPQGSDLDTAMGRAREAMTSVAAVATRPAPSVVPQLDGEAIVLACSFWVNQGEHDADSVASEIAQRLWDSERSAAAGGSGVPSGGGAIGE